MVQVLSKFAPIDISCKNYVHPWTESCAEATCGLYMYALVNSLRIYATVYLLSLLLKGRVPSLEDLKKTVKGIIQSTLFLSMNSFGYSVFLCLLRATMGNYNIFTVSFVPAFLASFFAVLIERPSRRGLLALYVSNIATESIWKMMVSRKMVSSVSSGEVFIFAGSLSILLAYFKSGLHKRADGRPDTMFDILKFGFGPYEEKDFSNRPSDSSNIHREERNELDNINNQRWTCNRTNSKNIVFILVMKALKFYKKFIYKVKCCDRHNSCPHPFSCIYYTLQRSTKMFGLGLALQNGLQLVLNLKTIIKTPKSIPSILLKRKNLNIATFLGGASGLFAAIMCTLRRFTGRDSALHALPAGLIAGLAFVKYPDNTIALYVFWKLLQITYELGIDTGYLPKVSHFIIMLYSFSTAVLFHSALVEPLTLRHSYWKFLYTLSGGRVALMDRKSMDVWGLDTSAALAKTMKMTRTKPVLSWYLIK